MKKIIILFLILFFGFIISLKLQSSDIPNIFIIEAIIAAVAYLLQAIYRIVYVSIIKKKAEKTYKCSFKNNSLLKLVFSVLPRYIALHNDDSTINLVIIFVRKRHAKYHFDSKSRLEVYVGNRETYRTGKVRYSIGKNVTWKLNSGFNIKSIEGAKSIFIFSKKPMDITSSDKKANSYLDNGDAFYEDCTVYSKKRFIEKCNSD